jgi:hypothetical protein
MVRASESTNGKARVNELRTAYLIRNVSPEDPGKRSLRTLNLGVRSPIGRARKSANPEG